MPNCNRPRSLLWATALFALILALPATANNELSVGDGWSELPRPSVGSGLMMEPRLTSLRSRVHLLWVGTSDDVRRPEVFHSSITGRDDQWNNPRAPFYGKNLGRVRKVAVGTARDLVAILFQRTLTQGSDAYEIRLSISGDHGWSWSNPIEVDSYVAERSGGTWVAIEGRQGMNRPEFAMSWVRDFGNIRAANLDIKSSLRPEGTLVGTHAPNAMKTEVATLGRDGFVAVFNNGQGLASSHVRGLTGRIAEAETVVAGRFGRFFTISSTPFGPARMALGSGRTVEAFTSDGTTFERDADENFELPFSAQDVDVESCLDDDKNLHLVIAEPSSTGYTLWYIGQNKRQWGELEKVADVETRDDIRGFDIAHSGDQIVIATSQGFRANFFRKKP